MMSTGYLRFALALALVLGLIMLCSWLMRRFRPGAFSAMQAGGRRLQLIESLTVGPQQRLVIIRRDDREHLLMLGADAGALIECDIGPHEEKRVLEQGSINRVGQ